jgi:hypothetical protein
MKTVTIREGRERLEYWLKKAVEGEDIGFVVEGKIVALRPVGVVSTDYALQEYGLTPKEMAVLEKRIAARLKTARVHGALTRFTGKKNDFHWTVQAVQENCAGIAAGGRGFRRVGVEDGWLRQTTVAVSRSHISKWRQPTPCALDQAGKATE